NNKMDFKNYSSLTSPYIKKTLETKFDIPLTDNTCSTTNKIYNNMSLKNSLLFNKNDITKLNIFNKEENNSHSETFNKLIRVNDYQEMIKSSSVDHILSKHNHDIINKVILIDPETNVKIEYIKISNNKG